MTASFSHGFGVEGCRWWAFSFGFPGWKVGASGDKEVSLSMWTWLFLICLIIIASSPWQNQIQLTTHTPPQGDKSLCPLDKTGCSHGTGDPCSFSLGFRVFKSVVQICAGNSGSYAPSSPLSRGPWPGSLGSEGKGLRVVGASCQSLGGLCVYQSQILKEECFKRRMLFLKGRGVLTKMALSTIKNSHFKIFDPLCSSTSGIYY